MNYARKLDIGLLCPNMEIRPQAPKNGIFQNFSFLWKGLQILLLTSPQPPLDIKFNSGYARKRIFGLLYPNMEIRPQAPKNGIFQNFSFLWTGLQISLLTSPQPPADIKIKLSYARKHIKKVESRTQLLNPEKGETSPLLKGSVILILYIQGPAVHTQVMEVYHTGKLTLEKFTTLIIS